MPMTSHERLAHTLKVRFGLPRDRPTDAELNQIIRDVTQNEQALGRPLTDDEWKQITYRHVRFTGKYIYEGLNFQDLNAMLSVIRAQAQARNRK
jgi:hypothetical protein